MFLYKTKLNNNFIVQRYEGGEKNMAGSLKHLPFLILKLDFIL